MQNIPGIRRGKHMGFAWGPGDILVYETQFKPSGMPIYCPFMQSILYNNKYIYSHIMTKNVLYFIRILCNTVEPLRVMQYAIRWKKKSKKGTCICIPVFVLLWITTFDCICKSFGVFSTIFLNSWALFYQLYVLTDLCVETIFYTFWYLPSCTCE